MSMWNDNFREWHRRNYRLIYGSLNAGTMTMLLLSIGYTLPIMLPSYGRVEAFAVNFAVGTVVAILFGLWTHRSTPRYPETPLEFYQELSERSIVKEWGEAIGWLRQTVAAAEETSAAVIQIHLERMQNGMEDCIRQTTLLTMHNRLCSLARAVADLCQRGQAEAAFIVWRSGFEIEVNMGYVAKDESDQRAVRFQDWGRAAFLRLNAPDSSELGQLSAKYPPPNELDREIGWTRAPNPLGMRGRAIAIGYTNGSNSRNGRALAMFEESSAYAHNDAMAPPK